MQLNNFFWSRVRAASIRLLKAYRTSQGGAFGTISVGNVAVSHLKPLGNFQTPGRSKAGRLSFQGMLEGRKVKVYSTFRPEQIALRVALQALPNERWGFPEIIAYDSALVVEEWINGEAVAKAKSTDRSSAGDVVADFFNTVQQDTRYTELASLHSDAFCYLQDYLIPRLGVWQHLNVVREFVSVWHTQYDEQRITSFISHADLSADNVFIEANGGRVLFIDNELLGAGQGWILDTRNSFINPTFDAAKQHPTSVKSEFIEMTWALRKAGSAFDAGEPGQAVKLLQNALRQRFDR